MALIQLDDTGIALLRDRFIGDKECKIVQGKFYHHQEDSQTWTGYSLEEARQLASAYLDDNVVQYMDYKGDWRRFQNSKANRLELIYALWDHGSYHEPHFFVDAPVGFAVGKSFLRVTAETINSEPLTAAHRARAALQYDLPANIADVPEPKHFLAALKRVFGDHEDGKRKILAFQEFLGACRVGIVTDFDRAIIMPGGGSNGKSTIIMGARDALFERIETRSIVPNFMNQEYYLMQMRDAAINVVTELPKEQVNCTERFKQIISGEDVTGRPIREMPVTFAPMAGHIFACNNFPRLSDNSKGMWRRLLVLKADAKFEKMDGLRADIIDRFKEEGAGILMWALQGAQRLMKQGDYTFPQSHFDEEAQWRGGNDRALQFVNNCTKGLGSGWSKASSTHKLFSAWMLGMGFPWTEKLDPGAFGNALKHLEGFDSKRQSYGMAYNFVAKPMADWLDYSNTEDSKEVQLELEEEKKSDA